MQEGRCWYLPHHGVYQSLKPGNFGWCLIVAPSMQICQINIELMSGPDLANQIFGMLLRFRKEHVAFMADIKSLFYQVLVPPHQRSVFYATCGGKKAIFQRKLLTTRCAHMYLVVLHPQVAQILY